MEEEVQIKTVEMRLSEVLGQVIVDNAKLGWEVEMTRLRGRECAAQLQGTQDGLSQAKIITAALEQQLQAALDRAVMAETRVRELELLITENNSRFVIERDPRALIGELEH